MKDFEKIEELLKSKAYHELSDSERFLVEQELGQEVYEELRAGITALKAEQIPVKRDVRQELMAEMRQKQGTSLWSVFRLKLPAYTHALPLLIIICLIFFMPKQERVVTRDRIVEVTVRDTIEVVKLDTLWRERMVQVPTPVYIVREVENKKPEESVQVSNRSLSDQQEVLDLVVRGE